MQTVEQTRKTSLIGQTAIVTGGAGVIGSAIAESLATAGARVALMDRSMDRLQPVVERIKAKGGTISAFIGDVTKPEDTIRVVDEVKTQYGDINLLVNNAGVMDAIGLSWETSPEKWREAVETNLVGPFILSRAILPSMTRRGQGRIINIVSGSGTRPEPGASSYSASKAGLINFTETLARELDREKTGVYVFGVAPGTVMTEQTVKNRTDPERRRVLDNMPPIEEQKWDSPEKTGELVVFLASGQVDNLSGLFVHARDGIDGAKEMSLKNETIRRNNLYALRMRKLEDIKH